MSTTASNHSTTQRTTTELRALDLLGAGTISIDTVATACGVTPARISQLLSDPIFAEEVSKRRFEALSKHNKRDSEYDQIEDALLKQFKGVMPLMLRPGEILKGLQIVNAAKRRGVAAPESGGTHQSVVTINMPTKIVQHFTTNINNQVIQAGSQELLTVQSGAMQKLVNAAHLEKAKIGVSDENGPKRIGASSTENY